MAPGLEAMCYLHTFDPMIIHRDLKSLNLLLGKKVLGPSDVPLAPRHATVHGQNSPMRLDWVFRHHVVALDFEWFRR